MPIQTDSTLSRAAAAIVALAALVGDALLLHETMAREQAGLLQGILTDTMFFSDLSTLYLAVIFALIALAKLQQKRPWLLGLSLACILLTSLGAQGWRGFTRPLSGSTLVHTWTPLAAALWCLIFAIKGRLRWKYVLAWTMAPLGYIAYATIRGSATGRWPYPWLNPTRVGWPGMAQGVAIQIVTFVVVAVLIVLADKLSGRFSRAA